MTNDKSSEETRYTNAAQTFHLQKYFGADAITQQELRVRKKSNKTKNTIKSDILLLLVRWIEF